MLRSVGYGTNVALSVISALLLLRYLGVERFGAYVTVTSLVAIAALVADAGLTAFGVREYVGLDPPRRRRLLEQILALRSIIAVTGLALALAFAVAAGFPGPMVAGTALAGVGMVILILQQSITVPLSAHLRFTSLTVLEVGTKGLSVAGIAILVVVAAPFIAFFAVTVPVAVVAAIASLLLARQATPGLSLREWPREGLLRLLRRALPVAAASILAALFYRVAMVEMSLLSDARETGYFAASLRVVEVILPVASLAGSTALPILTRAAGESLIRFGRAIGTLLEVSVIVGVGAAVVLALGAEAVLVTLGGDEYGRAAEVLQIQSIAVCASFVFAASASGLIALHAQRTLILVATIGVASVVLLTAVLVPAHGAEGAAVAMVVSEALLALAGIVAVVRHSGFVVHWGVIARIVAVGLAASCVALAGLPSALAAIVAALMYATGVFVSGAVPASVRQALRRVPS